MNPLQIMTANSEVRVSSQAATPSGSLPPLVSVVMPCDGTRVVEPDDRDTRLAPGMPPACQLHELMDPNVGGGRSGNRGPSAARYSYSLTLIGTSIT